MQDQLLSKAASGTGADGPVGCPVQDKDINFFPHLPPYSDPTTGFVSRLPGSWIPYAQLMRLERSAGLYAFYFPYLIALAYAACIAPIPPRPLTLLGLSALLLPFNILLRGAACTWNDTLDQRFDRRVTRCRHRPVARGAVSTGKAYTFTLAQLLLLYPLLTLFPTGCTLHALAAVILFAIYAFMKRVTHYPQVVLGIAFGWAVFFAVAALEMDPFANRIVWPTLALFGANVLWTVTYDTIYAHQDIADDEKAGVKGMAVRFRESTKILAGAMAVGQIILLAFCGFWGGLGRYYFVCTAGGVAGAMAWFIWDVDLKVPESCGDWFCKQFWIVGGAYVSGFAAEYLARIAVL